MSNHPGYWGGSTVKDGKVRRLPATTWKEFVERVINVPTQFSLTRKEFWALPTDKYRDDAKDGAFVCSCAFAGENEVQRNDANATHLTSVTLDLDSGDFLLELEKHPETISEALYPHNHVVWHTAKSRPGVAPRLKIMVEVAPCSPVYLKRFLSRVVFLLGIPSDFKGSKESSVVSQAQYRGILFKGETGTHIIASRVNGTPMHISDLPEIEPEDEELLNGRTYACDPSEADDEFFGLAYLPVAGLKPEDVREALNTIDPDVTRPVWMEVAAALRHQFTDEDEAKESHDMFVDWSSRGTKYAGRKDVWSMWRSLKPYCKGRAPITIRSLYHHAQAAGWENTKVATKLSQTIQEWFASCQNADELMLEGPKRIAGMPFKNDIVEESMMVAMRKRLAALGEAIDKATIRKEIARVRKADKKAKQESRQSELPPWLAPFVYISSLDNFYHLGSGVSLKPAAFDRTFALELMPKDGEVPANGVPIMQPCPYGLNILKMLRVDETLYDPTQPEDQKIFTCSETGKLLLNNYQHNSVPVADPEFKDQAEVLIRELVSYLIKEKYLQEHLLDYLAIQHQTPGVKVPWSFLIQSAPGVGKGTLGEILEATLGHQNVKLISPSMMSSSFNEWAIGAVLGIFNEVHIPGERRDAIMNSLKPLISDPIIAVSLKHRDGLCRVKNFTSYIAFTNEKSATYIAADDRRWCICFSPIQTKAKSEALQASGRFEAIRWLTTPEGASALRYFFLKRKISPDFPLKGHAPHTIYKAEVIEASKNTLQVQIEDLIEDNEEPLVSAEVIHDGRLKDKLCRNPRDASFLSRYLSLLGFERDGAKRVMLDGTRGHIWTHTEKWTGKDPVAFLKERMKQLPSLDETLPDLDEEIGFE